MKRKIFLLIFLLCFFKLQAQNYFSKHYFDTTKIRIIVLHPTVNNIINMCKLVDSGIINIPKIEIIGVFHAKEAYNYSQSIKYLKKNRVSYFKLHKINSHISKDSLYEKNACSNEFYRIFKNSRGIIFLGGPDIPPDVYNEPTNLLTQITDPYRHYMELSLMFHLLGGSQHPDFKPFLEERPTYIVLAFCLGMQTMNLATGGTLYQDIPTEIYGLNTVERVLASDNDNIHFNYWEKIYFEEDLSNGWYHHIKLLPNHFFTTILKIDTTITPLVFSAHHQCIKKLGSGLEIVATSTDEKIVEAIIHKKYKKVIGVQFHPEKFDQYNPYYKIKLEKNKETIPINEMLVKANTIVFYKMIWNYFLQLQN